MKGTDLNHNSNGFRLMQATTFELTKTNKQPDKTTNPCFFFAKTPPNLELTERVRIFHQFSLTCVPGHFSIIQPCLSFCIHLLLQDIQVWRNSSCYLWSSWHKISREKDSRYLLPFSLTPRLCTLTVLKSVLTSRLSLWLPFTVRMG